MGRRTEHPSDPPTLCHGPCVYVCAAPHASLACHAAAGPPENHRPDRGARVRAALLKGHPRQGHLEQEVQEQHEGEGERARAWAAAGRRGRSRPGQGACVPPCLLLSARRMLRKKTPEPRLLYFLWNPRAARA